MDLSSPDSEKMCEVISSYNKLIDHFEHYSDYVSDAQYARSYPYYKQKVVTDQIVEQEVHVREAILQQILDEENSVTESAENSESVQVTKESEVSRNDEFFQIEMQEFNADFVSSDVLIDTAPSCTVPPTKESGMELVGIMSRMGYYTLLKHYNRTKSIALIAMLMDPKKNYAYMTHNSWGSELCNEVKQT